jgi:beta-phosphoglucomutase
MTGLLVDLDGVLWFSESAHKDAFKKTLSDVLQNASELIDRTWEFGESTEKYIERLLRLYDLNFLQSTLDELVVLKRKFANEITDIPLNSPLIDSLGEVKNTGVLIGLVSSSSPSNVQKFLDNSNLRNFFDCVIDSSMTVAPKPDPSCYSLAMSRLGLAPRNCIVIEDSESGKEAAMGAGVSQILIFPKDFLNQQFTHTLISALSRANQE